MTNNNLFLHFNTDNVELAESISRVSAHFGSFKFEDEKIIFNNKENISTFTTVIDFATHLTNLMLKEQNKKWDDELNILMKNGVKAEGIRFRKGIKFSSCTATIDYPKNKPESRNNHATQLSAGTFRSPTEAYKARMKAVELRTQCLEKNIKLDEFREKLFKLK